MFTRFSLSASSAFGPHSAPHDLQLADLDASLRVCLVTASKLGFV